MLGTVLLCLLAAPAWAQSSYGLNELLRDARKTVERGLNSRGNSGQRRARRPNSAPPLPAQNPRRAERQSDDPAEPAVAAETVATDPPVEAPASKPPAAAEIETPIAPDAGAPAAKESDGPAPPELASAPEAPLPDRNPVRTGAMKLPPPHPSEIEAPDWTEKQIAEAKARCKKLISGETFTFEPLEPIREGICGTPAPIKLSSIQAGGKVRISPPATMTCELAAQLRHWLKDVVQPTAKRHLGAPIVRLRNVSAYSCRNVYNRAKGRMSHHALANALDVAGFETATGEKVVLIKHWNQMVPAKVPDEPPAESADEAGKTPEVAKNEGAQTGKSPIAGVTSLDPAKAADQQSGGAKSDANQKAPPVKMNAKHQKGKGGRHCCAAKDAGNSGEIEGDKTGVAKNGDEEAEAAPPRPPPPVPGPKRLFLRALHKGACGIFGTVLGPEANRAHHDHFHLDAKTRRSSFCE